MKAAALSILYFERRRKAGCLQNAYNNLLGGRIFELDSDLATQGSDINLVCSESHGVRQPLMRLLFDHEQLRALIPVVAEHMSGMIVFRGNPVSGDGHYETVRNINGHVFLLDSLQDGPQWLPDSAQYFRDLLNSPGRLVGAMVPASAPVIERYVGFLSRQVKQDIARGLGDVYGIQPIVRLEEYFRVHGIDVPDALQLAGFFHWQQMTAYPYEWVFNDLEALRDIDATLTAAANGHTRVLLMFRSHPYLIPAFFSVDHGGWQARVPSADGSRMETRLLQSLLDERQDEYKQMLAPAQESQRREEAPRRQISLGAVWLHDWPSNWPPVDVPSSTEETAYSEKENVNSGDKTTVRNIAADPGSAWIRGEKYTVKGIDPGKIANAVSGSRWRTQEFLRHGYKVGANEVRALSQALDAVPGEHLGEGIIVHRNVKLRDGRVAPKAYRKLDGSSNVLDIGIPIVGKLKIAEFSSKSMEARKKKREVDNKDEVVDPSPEGAIPTKARRKKREVDSKDEVVDFNTERAILERMFDRVRTLYPLAGIKRAAVEEEPSGIVAEALLAALNAPEVNCFVDAFAGTAYFTLWVAAQQRRGGVKTSLRLVTNEWDQYRYNTLKTVQHYPDQVKQALDVHRQRIKYLYYRVLNGDPVLIKVKNKTIREADAELARRVVARAGRSPESMTSEERMLFLEDTVNAWLESTEIDRETNDTLNGELKDYILDSIVYPLPPEPEHSTDEDIELRAANAALYLLAQFNNRFQNAPVNFSRAKTAGYGSRQHGLTVGSNSAIANRMLEIPSRLFVPKKQMTPQTNKSRLKIAPNSAEAATDHRALYHNLPTNIDRVSDALTGAEIRQGDGWELLHSLREGTVAVVDPLYWDPANSNRKKTYTDGESDEITKEGFFKKLDRFVMPAWGENNVRVALFNRTDAEFANAMERRGFKVFPLSKLNQPNENWSDLKEMMAINFTLDAGATLRRFIAHPAPSAPLGVAGDVSSGDEAHAVP